MPFTPDDIEPIGYVPGTTAGEYAVSRDGDEIGLVHLYEMVHLKNTGQDPRETVARRLNDIEQDEGFDRLASVLRSTLKL
jgi:hypothetical protein